MERKQLVWKRQLFCQRWFSKGISSIYQNLCWVRGIHGGKRLQDSRKEQRSSSEPARNVFFYLPWSIKEGYLARSCKIHANKGCLARFVKIFIVGYLARSWKNFTRFLQDSLNNLPDNLLSKFLQNLFRKTPLSSKSTTVTKNSEYKFG